MKRIIIIACLFLVNDIAFAQYPAVQLPGTQVRKITSSIVAGQEYVLHISLPGGYSNSNKKYPVVYVMDSQWDFPLVSSIYGQQYYDGFIPELIIVGVTWGGSHPNPDSLRARDYTPTNEKRVVQSGGADKFLSFMREELFPFIESNYKAGNDNRVLMGCSLGGLFTLYALFTHTDMFSGYIAASPAVGWDREVLYKYEQEFSAKKLNLPLRIYLTVGDAEKSRPAFEKMAALMHKRKYASTETTSKVLENTGHSGTKSETYTRGLQYIFQRPDIKIGNTVLDKYAGTYFTPEGNSFELKNENGRLVIYFSPTNKTELFAESEIDFYSTSEFLKLHYIIDSNNKEGFRIEMFNRSWVIMKKQ